MNPRRLPLFRLMPWCAAALAASPALAQVEVYGTLDLGVGTVRTQPPGAPNAAIVSTQGVHSGGLQTSYVGVRAQRDLGEGLRARFQIESFLRADTGKTGRFDASPASEGDYFWSREAFAALGGSWGEVRLGNNANPVWISMIQTSAMGSNSVFSPGFRQLFNGGARGLSEVDTSLVNSVKYQSPVWEGFSGSLAWQSAEERVGEANQAFQLGYRQGALHLSVARSSVRHAAPPNNAGEREQDMTLLGGSYDLGVVKLFGQYTDVDNPRLGRKDKVTHLGLTAPMGRGTWQLARAQDKTDTTVGTTTASSQRTTTTLGYVHALRKDTELYAFVMQDQVSVGKAKSQMVGLRQTF